MAYHWLMIFLRSHPIWLGIVTSFIASVAFAVLALLIAARIQWSRAKRFTGTFKMLDENNKPTGGTVTIKHDWWANLIGRTPVLKVSARHEDGKEDWRGTVEVTGLDEIASGVYWHPNNRAVGTLRFALTETPNEINEYGTPYDPKLPQFIRILRKV
jgi:hypothetical protein